MTVRWVVVIALFVAWSSFAYPASGRTVPVRTPAAPASDPIPLDSEVVDRLESITSALVYRVEPGRSPECEPVLAASDESILCHRVTSRSQAPDPAWTTEMATLIRMGMREPPDLVFHPEVAIRFQSGEAITEVLISISQDMAEIQSTGRPGILGSFHVSPQMYFPVLARAFSSEIEVRNLIERGPTRNQPGRAYNPAILGPFWPDCVPGASEGEFVYYDEMPVPLQSPSPDFPPGLQKSERGRVMVHAFVDVQGKVCFARVIQGKQPFEKYVLDAIRRWVFKPATVGGSPIGVWVEIPFDT